MGRWSGSCSLEPGSLLASQANPSRILTSGQAQSVAVSCMRSRGHSGPAPAGIHVITAPLLAESTGRSQSMRQPWPSDQEGKGREPVSPGAGLSLALAVTLYLWVIPARSSVSSQERAMPHTLRPPRWEGSCLPGWGDAPGVGSRTGQCPHSPSSCCRRSHGRQIHLKNKPSLASAGGGLKIPECVCFSNSGEIKPAYSQEIIRFPESPG